MFNGTSVPGNDDLMSQLGTLLDDRQTLAYEVKAIVSIYRPGTTLQYQLAVNDVAMRAETDPME